MGLYSDDSAGPRISPGTSGAAWHRAWMMPPRHAVAATALQVPRPAVCGRCTACPVLAAARQAVSRGWARISHAMCTQGHADTAIAGTYTGACCAVCMQSADTALWQCESKHAQSTHVLTITAEVASSCKHVLPCLHIRVLAASADAVHCMPIMGAQLSGSRQADSAAELAGQHGYTGHRWPGHSTCKCVYTCAHTTPHLHR